MLPGREEPNGEVSLQSQERKVVGVEFLPCPSHDSINQRRSYLTSLRPSHYISPTLERTEASLSHSGQELEAPHGREGSYPNLMPLALWTSSLELQRKKDEVLKLFCDSEWPGALFVPIRG